MITFSIAELEQFTSIKAHTFRTWEHRFTLFKPKRKATNTRFYDLDDMAFLLDFTLLIRSGYKVSALAKLDKATIRRKVLHIDLDSFKKEHVINQLIIYAYSIEIEDFEMTLDCATTQWGIDTVIEEIILPFIERIQLFSYKGHTASIYHLIVTAVRKKIIFAIELAKPMIVYEKSALLFLPKGEHFDLLLLYMNYKLRKAGLNVLYLGTDVAAENLKMVAQKKQPHFLVTYDAALRSRYKDDIQQYLVETNPETSLIVGAPHVLFSEGLPSKVRYTSYRQIHTELIAAG